MKSRTSFAVIAIPAHNEEQRIETCLAALAVQRDEFGCPIPPGAFEILIFANNCTDATAARATAFAKKIPNPLTIVNAVLPAVNLSAGSARKHAMDLAAIRLGDVAPGEGLIFTTDADSYVSPNWFAATLREFSRSIDCVAGYIDAFPLEYVELGLEFVRRGRLEDAYLRAVAEIHARCDARPHDPWPNHRVSSGASLAVTLAAYSGIGGLPQRDVGEDAALTEALDRAGYKVRHSLDVCVFTSCRLDGRARGGAADTMRERHLHTDAFCDADLEPALPLTRRALYKGLLRQRWDQQALASTDWPVWLGIDPSHSNENFGRGTGFEDFWRAVCASSPTLQRKIRLRPSDLPHQIERAETILRAFRMAKPRVAQADILHPARLIAPAVS